MTRFVALPARAIEKLPEREKQVLKEDGVVPEPGSFMCRVWRYEAGVSGKLRYAIVRTIEEARPYYEIADNPALFEKMRPIFPGM